MGCRVGLVVLVALSITISQVETNNREKRDSGERSSEEESVQSIPSLGGSMYVLQEPVIGPSRRNPAAPYPLPSSQNTQKNSENPINTQSAVTGLARQETPVIASTNDSVPVEAGVLPSEVQNDDPNTGQTINVGSPTQNSQGNVPINAPVNTPGSRFTIPENVPGAAGIPGVSGPGARIDGALVANIIREAIRKVSEEDRILELRLLLGIDKTVTQFQTPEPEIFADSPFNITPMSRLSRIINWIGTMLKDFKIPITPRAALTHPAAVVQRIICPFQPPVCNFQNKYRTIDGQCNNVDRPLMGSAFTPMDRELPPVYENARGPFPFGMGTESEVIQHLEFIPPPHKINIGYSSVFRDPLGKIGLPRSRGAAAFLPSARRVSSVVHAHHGAEERSTRWSMQLTLWGQMFAHDVTDRAPGKGFAGSVMSCCNERIKTPLCFGIPVPVGDSFRDRGKTCLDFARSAEVTDIDCKLGRREQLNQASSYIDAGFIYGVTGAKLRNLRTASGGLLATSINDHLPIVAHPNRQASMQGFSFFTTGDDRVNEHTGLVGMETVWVREHNRIAKQLGAINPNWTDEILFQETRRIIGALVQHITYNEFLPQVIGEARMNHFGLQPLKKGYFKGYDVSTNAGVSNVFTTSAARFGHSMMRSTFNLMDMSFSATDSPVLPLKDTFFTSLTFLQTEHAMMRGTMMDQSEPCDRMISRDLRNNLLQTKDGNGGDLAAQNIQRGRDHGLPSYTVWREFYGFPKITNFTNGTGGFVDHPMETIELLEQVYDSVEDVDVWTGGISELPVDDAAVGPLFANMIGHQMKKLKYGDRYFYESDEQPIPFTPEQLQEIRKVTYASVLCNNLSFRTIQREAFLLTSDDGNAKVPCAAIERMSFSPWREV